jgi:hypothetical protein
MARATALLVANSGEALQAEIVAAYLRDVLRFTVYVEGSSDGPPPSMEQLLSVDFLIAIYPSSMPSLDETDRRRLIDQRAGRSIMVVPWQITDEPYMGGWKVETYSPLPGDMVRGLSVAIESIRQSVLWYQQAQLRKRRIFLSYRRGDTADITGWLCDSLREAYGADRVFMDIDNIPVGANFREQIRGEIQTCCAVVVIIGQHWTQPGGSRGIHDDNDMVRAEIAAALSLGVPVVPVFVHGARMPSGEHLPEDIRPISSINGTSLAAPGWRDDIARLRSALDPLAKP